MSPCRTHREEAEMVVEQIEKLLGGTRSFSMDSGRVGSNEGAEALGFGDMAVLFRLNAQAEALEEALSRAGIPYRLSGQRPLTAREPVHLLWRFLTALCHPGNDFYRKAYLSLLDGDAGRGERNLRSMSTQAGLAALVDKAAILHGLDGRGDDAPEALRRLRDLASSFEGDLPSFLDALDLERGIDHGTLEGDRVALMTFHAAKGLEWPVVFLTGLEDGVLPLELYGDADEEEERRLFYVALTRAESRICLSWAARRSLGPRSLERPPSRFLRHLPEALHTPVDRASWRPRRRQEQLSLF
jgi:DNA helicase-2/ATP-dependent DNA helicase PcrA